MKKLTLIVALFITAPFTFSQTQEEVIQKIMDEAYGNSQLKVLGHELMDQVGPRLVGTPQMQQAHDWAVDKYKTWNIPAENQKWGEWRSWERGITHIDMVHPRVQSLRGMQLAWSPTTSKKGITAEVIALPTVNNEAEFKSWLPKVKGKFVMIAMPQPTGRPDHDWKEWATEESFERMKTERNQLADAWQKNLENTGLVTARRGVYAKRKLIEELENAGAAGIVDSYWSGAFGTQKIFSATTKKIPVVDIELEDYGMIYRLAESGDAPKLHITAISKDLGVAPTFNTIARIEGSEKPEEYVILSAHFDSWDGGTGATDNGTGTILMMEVMRILKKVYPNPKRTIIVGHWGSEEQGLNGSASFVEDHPEIVKNIQAVFNQDNGTGRVKSINGSGFLHSYNYISRWLSAVPDTVFSIETQFPGNPASGGTDHASFVRAGAPAFNLNATSWSYWNYTWHTNRDTYDKIVWEDIQNNVILTAVLAYMASEDEETVSREQIILPVDKKTGNTKDWPNPIKPTRKGGLD